MATKWGAYKNRQRVGIDVSVTNGVTQASPNYTVHVWLRQQTDFTFFNFDGKVVWSGSAVSGGSHTGRLHDDDVFTHFDFFKTWNANYDSTQSFSIKLDGTTDGTSGTSTVSRTITVPRRPTAKPGLALNPFVDQITSSSLRGNWSNSGDWNGPTSGRLVRVQLATNSSFTNIIRNVEATPPNDDWTFTNLNRATTYYFRCARRGDWWDAFRRGDWSSTVSVKTLPDIPSAPHSYAAQEISRSSASGMGTKVSDNGGESPDDIRVQWNTSADPSGATTKTMGAWVKTRMTGLSALTEYFFRHAVHNSAGWSSYGPWESFTTLTTAPDNPAEPTFSSINDDNFVVSWVEPALNGATITGYRVRVARDENMTTIVKDYTADPTTGGVHFFGLNPGTNYWADVQALADPDSSGVSEPGAVTTTGDASTLFPQINVGGTWHPFVVWVNVGGTWEQAQLGLNVGGVWKETV